MLKPDVETDLERLPPLMNMRIKLVMRTNKFSFFSKIPGKGEKWYEGNASNKRDYFQYISEGRIPGVAIRGGLSFAKFVDNIGHERVANNSNLTVEDGISLMVETDLLASFKWMKNLEYTNDLYTLSNPKYQSLLPDEDTKTKLREIYRRAQAN